MNKQSKFNFSQLNNASRFDNVEFYIMSDEEIKNTAAVEIFDSSNFDGEIPKKAGLYDSALGSISSSYNCELCDKNPKKCTGHYGYYKMKYPLVQKLFTPFILKNLKLICIRCKRYILDPNLKLHNGANFYNIIDEEIVDEDGETIDKYRYKAILDFMYKKKWSNKSKATFCDYCNNVQNYLNVNKNLKKFIPNFIQPNYVAVKIERSDLYENFLVFEEQSKFNIKTKKYMVNQQFKNVNNYSVYLFPKDVKERFEMLKDEELIKHHININTHPKNFIRYYLVIPPSNLRYPNKTDGGEYHTFITTTLANIINYDKSIDNIVTYHDSVKFQNQLKILAEIANLNSNYMDNKSKDEADTSCIYKNIKGKKGIIRDRLLGKTIGGVFRCVITCKNSDELDTIFVPRKFAEIICIEETATPYNIKRLQKFVDNGKNYPGCIKIRDPSRNGNEFHVKTNNGVYKIKVGDIVLRNLVNGDRLPITRFPSLFVTSTICVTVKVYEGNKMNNSVGVPMQITTHLNGDFDGDTVSSFYLSNEASRAQFSMLANIDKNFTSGIDGTTLCGLLQDSIIGCGLFTRSASVFTITQTKHILNKVDINVKLENRNYTGRELFSLALPNISLEVPSPFFKNKIIEQYQNFDPNDKIVKIVNGKLVSGIVCDALIKAGKKNSIYHIIYNYYGPIVALNVIKQHHIMISNFIRLHGVTLDYNSFIVSDKSKELIRITQSSVIHRVNEINKKVLNRELVPPSGVSIYDYVESLTVKEFKSVGQKYIAAILADTDVFKNWLFMMCLNGSKGSLDNIEKMLCTIGQVYIDQKRIPFMLDYFRTCIWHRQFDISPFSRGYVTSSYISGYNLSDLYYLAREGRNNIITKGLVTAEAGAEGRNVIKGNETKVVDNRCFVSSDNGTRITQFNPGDDCINYKNLFPSKYPLFGKDNKFIKDNFHPDLVDTLIMEKQLFLNNCIQKEKCNLSYTANDGVLSPLNIPQIFNIVLSDRDDYKNDKRLYGGDYDIDIFVEGGATKNTNKSKLAEIINTRCDNICSKRFGSKLYDDIKKNGKEMPDIFNSPFTIIKMLIRSSFNNEILDKLDEQTLNVLFSIIENQISKNIVEPGLAYGVNVGLTLTSPFTQYLIDAHHVSAGGGTSRDDIKQFKSIAYLKDSDKIHDKRTYVFVKPEFEQDEMLMKKLANFIETQYLKTIIIEIRGLFEKHNEYTTFPDDKIEIEKSKTLFGLNMENIHNIIFRLRLNANLMKSKNIEIQNVIDKLFLVSNQNTKCAFYKDKNGEYILYMYFNKDYVFDINPKYLKKKRTNKSVRINFVDRILDFAYFMNPPTSDLSKGLIINDFEGLNNIKVKELNRSKFVADKLVAEKIYYLEIDGINLRDIATINVVDMSRTFCNNLILTLKYFGIMETRNKLIDILNTIFEPSLGLLVTNYILMADIFTETGTLTSYTVNSLLKREKNDYLLAASYKDPMSHLSDAAIDGVKNNNKSICSNLIMGQVMDVGTKFNKLIRNPESYSAEDVEDMF